MEPFRLEGKTAQEWDAAADACEKRAAESFVNCDTDGFLSQAASQASARLYRQKASICRNNGYATFPALFNLDGTKANAKLVSVPNRFNYGRKEPKWLVLDDQGNPLKWLKAFPAKQSTLAKHGYKEGSEEALANARFGEGFGWPVYVYRLNGNK